MLSCARLLVLEARASHRHPLITHRHHEVGEVRQRVVRLEIVTENRPPGHGLLPSFNVQKMAIFTLRTLEANGPERPAPMIRDESRRTRDFLKKELPILRAVDVVKAAHRPILQPRNSQILDELGSNTKTRSGH